MLHLKQIRSCDILLLQRLYLCRHLVIESGKWGNFNYRPTPLATSPANPLQPKGPRHVCTFLQLLLLLLTMLSLLLLLPRYPGANCMAHAHKVSRQVHKPNMLCVCHGMWVVLQWVLQACFP